MTKVGKFSGIALMGSMWSAKLLQAAGQQRRWHKACLGQAVARAKLGLLVKLITDVRSTVQQAAALANADIGNSCGDGDHHPGRHHGRPCCRGDLSGMVSPLSSQMELNCWLCADVRSTAQQAAALAHADLATAVVMEMTALAGTMGRHYAQQEGQPAPVCEAIYESVLPRNSGDSVPSSPAGEAICLSRSWPESVR